MKISYVVSLEKNERKKYPNSPSSIRSGFLFRDDNDGTEAVLHDLENDIRELRGLNPK